MSTYLTKQIKWFENIEADIARAANPRHASILRTYMAHAAYELVGEAEELLGPKLMSDEPRYVVFGFGSDGIEVYDGKAEIKARFYDVINEGVVLVYDEERQVHDWGLTMEATVSIIVDKSQLPNPDDWEDGKYIVERRCVERWPFDELGRVAGEEVYQVEDEKISQLLPDDVVTEQERNDAIRRFLPTEPANSAAFSTNETGTSHVQA